MLLPRPFVPGSIPPRRFPSVLGSPGGPFARRVADTIDDASLRAELASALVNAPFHFLTTAARAVSIHGEQTPALIEELAEAPWPEGHALAVGLGWLHGVAPPDGLDASTPPWLAALDLVEIAGARRRREDHAPSVSSYLVDLCLVDGSIGTLHARIDHELDGALVDGFVVDGYSGPVQQALLATDGWRASRPAAGRRTPFRSIQPGTARRALAGAVEATVETLPPLDLHRPWATNRPLLAFVAFPE